MFVFPWLSAGICAQAEGSVPSASGMHSLSRALFISI